MPVTITDALQSYAAAAFLVFAFECTERDEWDAFLLAVAWPLYFAVVAVVMIAIPFALLWQLFEWVRGARWWR